MGAVRSGLGLTLDPNMGYSTSTQPYQMPQRCGMPDLSDLFKENAANLVLTLIFRAGHLPDSFQASVLLRTFVRLVDLTVEEYEFSRIAFHGYVRTEPTTFPLPFRVISHLETCIAALDRSCRFVRRMQEDQEFSNHILDLSVMSKKNRKIISTLRNATEHLDSRILDGKITEGDFIMIAVREDRCELQGISLSYIDLSDWVKELHALATKLACEGTQ